MPIRFDDFSVTEYLAKVGDMVRDHWDEVAKNKHLMVLAPDVERYAQLEQAGQLLCVGAFDEAGQMVGYSVNFIGTNLHYKALTYAHNDVVFVAKSHREGRLGLQLLRETERRAKERGARLIVWHAKENTALAKILPRMGYGVQDILLSKEL
jgi:predicted GNAT superfamily acetyltransferase